MKHFFVLLLIAPLISLSQVSQVKGSDEKSKIERVTLKTGSLLKIESTDVGQFVEQITLYSQTIKARGFVTKIKVNDLSNNTRLSGVEISFFLQDKYQSCFMDLDEIDSFIESANLLFSFLNDSKGGTAKYIYTTNSGFQAGANQEKEKTEYYIQLNKYDSNSNLPLAKEDFQKLIQLLVTAKTK